MDHRFAERFERLRMLSEHDLAALPDRCPSPVSTMDDRYAQGGRVTLVPEAAALDHTQDTLLSPISAACKRSCTPEAETAMHVSEEKLTPHTNGQSENADRKFVWIPGTESSYNLGSKPQLSALLGHPLPPAVLRRSQLAPPEEKYFTPIVALSKYPYKFCNKDCMQEIASAFFDQGKFWAREWDLYYLWDIEESKPLILVRDYQVHTLLTQINSHLNLGLKITDSQREEGLILRFPDLPRCRPRYLGRSHTKDEYNSMTDQVPSADVRAPSEADVPPLDLQALADFKQMIEDAWEVQKNKSKASKEKKRVDRLKKQKVLTDQLKRAQRYLGLRPTASTDTSALTVIEAVDVSRIAPFAFDRSVVFVCVDVEAYERDHSKITEIGIATLDTNDLLQVAPGKDGEHWRSKIQTRHFRIAEYAHLVNSEFVAGRPGSFFFGQSEFVSREDAPASVAKCFEPPFCGKPIQSISAEELDKGGKRSLIFLGHNSLADVKYLQDIGFDPLSLPNLLEAQDSASLFRVWQRQEQPSKLAKILEEFGIDQFGLHNAGNDAAYTVQGFLAICVREASIRNKPEVQKIWDKQMESRIAFEQQELKDDIEKDMKGWSGLKGDDDGGEPVPLVIKKPAVRDVSSRATPSKTGSTAGDGCSGPLCDQDESKDTRGNQVSNPDGWGGEAVW